MELLSGLQSGIKGRLEALPKLEDAAAAGEIAVRIPSIPLYHYIYKYVCMISIREALSRALRLAGLLLAPAVGCVGGWCSDLCGRVVQ